MAAIRERQEQSKCTFQTPKVTDTLINKVSGSGDSQRNTLCGKRFRFLTRAGIHHNSKASILQHSAFFTVQLSHPYTTTGKTIAFTRRTLVAKVMSLLLNILSRLVITFLPRSKRLLISWLHAPSAVILEPKQIKSDTVSTVSPSISHEVMGPDAMIFVF